MTVAVLSDCTRCGGRRGYDVDDYLRPIEVCTECGLVHPVTPEMDGIPRAVRAVRILAAAGDLQPVLCRACTAGRHGTCWRLRCTCDHGGPDAAA